MTEVIVVLKDFGILGLTRIYNLAEEHEVVKRLNEWRECYPDEQPSVTREEIEQAATRWIDADFDLEIDRGVFFSRP